MQLFTDAENQTWRGGFYELAIELGSRSDERLEAALLAIWENCSLTGCYLHQNLEPDGQQRVQPSLALLERQGHLFGVVSLPNKTSAACGVVAIREDWSSEPVERLVASGVEVVMREEPDSDWLVFYIPMGALVTACDAGAFPFPDGKESAQWRVPLDGWLVELAKSVYAVAPFRLALVGHEVSGQEYAHKIDAKGIPAERWIGYLWEEGSQLVWYAPTIYDAPFR